jgi:hypothetical protein
MNSLIEEGLELEKWVVADLALVVSYVISPDQKV